MRSKVEDFMIRQSNRYSRRVYRQHDPLGPISFGIFLIIVAVIALANPNLPGQFIDYLKSFGEVGYPLPPPEHILRPVAEFCLLFGVWLIVLASLRISFRLGTYSAPGDMCGGIFLIVFNYLILDAIKKHGDIGILIAYFIIGLGVSTLVGGIGRSMIRRQAIKSE